MLNTLWTLEKAQTCGISVVEIVNEVQKYESVRPDYLVATKS